MELRNTWSSYASLACQYRETAKKLKDSLEAIKESSNIDADLDTKIISQMVEEAGFIADELHKKILYSYNMLSEEELSLFTDRQREVLELRQKYKPKKVAEILGITSDEVFNIYKQALKKIEKYNKQKLSNIQIGLSPQQEKIYILYSKGKKYTEIANELNISINTLKKQLKRIKQKRVTNLYNFY